MKYAPYSFSKINTFYDCPKRFDFTYINKIPQDKDFTDPSYFVRGRFIHKYIADRLKGKDGMLDGFSDIDIDDKLNLIDSAEETLSNEYVSISYDFDVNGVERPVYLNHDMKPSKKAGCAMLGYIDYFAVHQDFGMIIDWKSGKYRDNPFYDQLELYGIWLMEKYPDVNEVDLVFYYVEHDKFSVKTVTRDDVDTFKKNLIANIDVIEIEEEFAPKPSKSKCLHCPFFDTCSEEFGIML